MDLRRLPAGPIVVAPTAWPRSGRRLCRLNVLLATPRASMAHCRAGAMAVPLADYRAAAAAAAPAAAPAAAAAAAPTSPLGEVARRSVLGVADDGRCDGSAWRCDGWRCDGFKSELCPTDGGCCDGWRCDGRQSELCTSDGGRCDGWRCDGWQSELRASDGGSGSRGHDESRFNDPGFRSSESGQAAHAPSFGAWPSGELWRSWHVAPRRLAASARARCAHPEAKLEAKSARPFSLGTSRQASSHGASIRRPFACAS